MEHLIDFTKLDRLKELVLLAEDFSTVWSYFFDHFGDHERFLDVGKRVKYPVLKSLLETVAQQTLLQPGVKMTNFLLIEIAKYRFYHGAFMMGNRLVNLIFYKDVDAGMIIIAPASKDQPTLFARFSLGDTKESKAVN